MKSRVCWFISWYGQGGLDKEKVKRHFAEDWSVMLSTDWRNTLRGQGVVGTVNMLQVCMSMRLGGINATRTVVAVASDP